SQLSAYERKRLKNIMENAKFFAALNLHKVSSRFEGIVTKREAAISKRAKPKRTEDELVLRRSMRLQRVEPEVVPEPEVVAQPKEDYPEVPDGPLPMGTESLEGRGALAEDLLATWMRISEEKAEEAREHPQDVERYLESLRGMVLREENVRKVVKSRVCSVAIHPATSSILVAAGDTTGRVGLWNVDCGSAEAARTYTVHNHVVSCLHFSPCNPAHLLSLGSDGLRCGDVTRAVFDQVFRAEESSSFDFLEASASTAIVGHWEGRVAVVDRRTPRTTSELSADIGFTRTRTVHVHPVNRQYFLAAGAVDVCIFDVRYLKARGNRPVSCLPGHTRSVASAYFSPITGNRVVTLSADDRLRVFDTSSMSSTAALHCAIRAVWEPKRDDCFVVGSLLQPRRIEVFGDSGQLLHCFSRPDCLTSVCCVNALHPHRNVLVGGNSSGRLFVF
ncbi:WDR76 protein, partial [Rhinopomastus cyanomelas]|nr:WDR76 protein [Rhinopomastus cyanomelas]